MNCTQEALLVLNLLLTAVSLFLLAFWSMRRRARLYTSLIDKAILAAGSSFLVIVPASFAAVAALDMPVDVVGGALPLFLLLGVTLSLTVLLVAARLPDSWILANLAESKLQEVLDKALAQSELQPERTFTGLHFDAMTILRLYYWAPGRTCLLEWHPRGASARYPEFRDRLIELVDSVPSRPFPLAASCLAAMGCLFSSLAAILAIWSFCY